VCFGEDLWLVEEMDVEEHPDLPDVVLRPGAAGPARRTQDSSRPVPPSSWAAVIPSPARSSEGLRQGEHMAWHARRQLEMRSFRACL
jgi:hypothetical protein